MFARQMAVMKGQAWNVVETLKTPDHGPLELTRRTRVYVWDDLVDVPVAVPLRAPSSEMRRQAQARFGHDEEMDISAALASAPLQRQHDDLLGPASPTDLGSGNRFNLSRESSHTDVRLSEDSQRTALTIGHKSFRSDRRAARHSKYSHASSSRVPQSLESSPRQHRRHFSFSHRSHGSGFYGDDDEGDLGYAAAEDMENNLKKVIVERLETVKGRNPVFTWC
jgi:phosphatidylinositol 4-kinase type 2